MIIKPKAKYVSRGRHAVILLCINEFPQRQLHNFQRYGVN